MVRILKSITLILLLTSSLYGQKIYFYTTENNINDFKNLKSTFDDYLNEYGKFTFHPFTNKEKFETFLKDDEIVVFLSSWHYNQIFRKYALKARLVALKNNKSIDTKVLVGKKDTPFGGKITTAFSRDYTNKLFDELSLNRDINIIKVSKEIDALMAVGFGMSQFALVSKDSFEALKKVNSFLAKQLIVFKESKPKLRMLIATKDNHKHTKLKGLFENMRLNKKGKKVLNILGVDDIVALTPKLKQGGAK